jgi:hypothetical protein
MKLSTIQIEDYKSFDDSGVIPLGQINIVVGRNNSGKSALIQAARNIQEGAVFSPGDIRIGTNLYTITYGLEGAQGNRHNSSIPDKPSVKLELRVPGNRTTLGGIQYMADDATNLGSGPIIRAQEPTNFVYTYLSKRKVMVFDKVVDQNKTLAVNDNLQYLVAKVARLSNPTHPKYQEYTSLCEKVLGFVVSEHAAPGGQQAGIPVGNFDYIPIEAMGEGVSSLLGLITDLCMADENLFLLEELENDIHPEGLKAVLEVIIEKSQHSQFIVSTHSNIVTKYLGAAPGSRVFNVSLDYEPGRVPTSTIREVGSTPEARIEVLRQLGYELYDFDLWEGWLILEESSAEVIIRYLIPWFVPDLSRIRTVAAGGTSKVEPTFEDFRRLFLFAHLERQYKGRAWVIVDDDDEGKRIMAGLRDKHKDWPAEHFNTWRQADFEHYYPRRFDSQVQAALAMSHDAKRAAKKQLLDEVKAWCDANPEEARAELEQSAADVIDRLKAIQQSLFKPSHTSMHNSDEGR